MSRGSVPAVGPPTGPPATTRGCTVLHVDMDAFYASVELRTRPELRGLPVIVGGGGRAGVVLSATYEARATGVHSAMPMARARRMCPQAVVISPDHGAYAEVSHGVMEVFRTVTPLVEPISLDEAFLDVRGAARRLGGAAADRGVGPGGGRGRAGHHLLGRGRVHEVRRQARLGALQARRAARRARGRGRRLPAPAARRGAVGRGEKTEEVLLRLGLHTVGDIANTPLATLQRALGPASARTCTPWPGVATSAGSPRSSPTRASAPRRRSPSTSTTPQVIHRELLRLSERTAARLRAKQHVGRTVSIKVRFSDFTTITRARTLREPTDVGREVYETAVCLFDALGLERARLRLVGVRVEGITDAGAAPRAAAAGREGLRLAGGGAGRRPGGAALRRGSRPPAALVRATRGRPVPQAAAAPRTGRRTATDGTARRPQGGTPASGRGWTPTPPD